MSTPSAPTSFGGNDPHAQDELAIRKIIDLYRDSWNEHSMKALGSVFSEDADFVNVRGMRRKGLKEIEERFAERHRTHLRESKAEIGQVDIRFISSEVALIHGDMRVEGDRDPDGTLRPLPTDTIFTAVAQKEADEWRLVAFQNTKKTA